MADAVHLIYGWESYNIKFNPNHDRRGRFTTGGAGAGARGVAGAGAGAGEGEGQISSTHGEGYNSQGTRSLPIDKGGKVQLSREGKYGSETLTRAQVATELSRANKLDSAIEIGWGGGGAAKYIGKAAVEDKIDNLSRRTVGTSSRFVALVTAKDVGAGDDASRVLGVMSISTYRVGVAASSNRIYVDFLAVSPQAQGKGVGSALLREAAREGVRRGYGGLKLTALDSAATYYRHTLKMKETDYNDFSWTRSQMTRFAAMPRTAPVQAAARAAPRKRGVGKQPSRATAKIADKFRASFTVTGTTARIISILADMPKSALRNALRAHGVTVAQFNGAVREVRGTSKALSGISAGAILGAGNQERQMSSWDEIIAGEPSDGAFASRIPVFSIRKPFNSKGVELRYEK